MLSLRHEPLDTLIATIASFFAACFIDSEIADPAFEDIVPFQGGYFSSYLKLDNLGYCHRERQVVQTFTLSTHSTKHQRSTLLQHLMQAMHLVSSDATLPPKQKTQNLL